VRERAEARARPNVDCANQALDDVSCELIDIDGLRGSARSLYVPTTGTDGERKRADDTCAEVAGVAEH
jgi:hypothetical protein